MMQTYSPEILKRIEECSGLFYAPDQIKVMLELDDNFLLEVKMEGTPVFNAYWKGFYESELKFRKKLIDTALLGSSPAQSMVNNLIEISKKNIINR